MISSEPRTVKAGIAVHGRRVLAHIVMRKLGDASLRDPEGDVHSVLANLELTGYVDSLVAVFPENAYPGNVFKNQARVIELLRAAGLTS